MSLVIGGIVGTVIGAAITRYLTRHERMAQRRESERLKSLLEEAQTLICELEDQAEDDDRTFHNLTYDSNRLRDQNEHLAEELGKSDARIRHLEGVLDDISRERATAKEATLTSRQMERNPA